MATKGSLFPDADSGGFKRQSRSDSGGELDITPMIDVTFLLLIFFMVTSSLEASRDLDVPPARHGIGVQASDTTVVTIKLPSKSVGETPLIFLGDGNGEQGTIDEVRAYVEEGLKDNRNKVIIKADREIPHGFVQKVAKAVTAVEGIEFYIGVKDKR